MKIFNLLLSGVLMSLSPFVFATVGEDIMKNALDASYYSGLNVRMTAHMTITDRQGRERIREMVLLRRNINDAGDQKYYVYFNKPSDVKKMVFMAWKNSQKDDDRWLYLPALDLVKRIAASDERTSFVGSDFYYEDISGRNIDEDSHILIKENSNHYVIESKPYDETSVEFTNYQAWIDKKSYLPTKIVYFKNDEEIREYKLLKMENIEGYPTVIKAQIMDLRTGGKTIIDYSTIEYSRDIPAKIFSERFLRKSPKKYLN